MRKITDKQKLFCIEYPKDLNATQAAIRAGYSNRSAKAIGYENLTKPYLLEIIGQHQKEVAETAEVEAVEVLRELKKLGFSNIKDYLSFGEDGVTLKESEELTDGQLAAVAEVSENTTKCGVRRLRLKLYDKKGALELLGRHLKLFTEQEDKPTNITIINNIGPKIRLEQLRQERDLLLQAEDVGTGLVDG